MSEKIEIHPAWAKNQATDSKFSLNLVPPDFAEYECMYEHPRYGLKLGIRAKWISEQKSLEINGKIIEGTVNTGLILIAGELRKHIGDAVRGRANEAEISELVQDCYNLMIHFIKGQHEFDRFGITPHVYEAEIRRFSVLPGNPARLGPAAIGESQAKLIF